MRHAPWLLLPALALGLHAAEPARLPASDDPPPPPPPSLPKVRQLPAQPPASLRETDLDQMLAWMGLRVGDWEIPFVESRTRLPEAWRVLPPREAAWALVQANLRANEAETLRVSFAPTTDAGPPAEGWIVFELFRRSYLDFEDVQWLSFGPEHGTLRFLSEGSEQTGPVWSTCQLPPAEARWLAETVWWLAQLKVEFLGEPSSGRITANHGPDGRLQVLRRTGPNWQSCGHFEHYFGGSAIGPAGPPAALIVPLAGRLLASVRADPPAYLAPLESLPARRRELAAALADPHPWPLSALRVALRVAERPELPQVRRKARASIARTAPSLAMRADFERFFAQQDRFRDTARLVRLASNPRARSYERREALTQLALFDAPAAARVLERNVHRFRELERGDWTALESMPPAVRTGLLERLRNSRTLSAERRAAAEFYGLQTTPEAQRDDAQLARFLADRRHEPRQCYEILQLLLDRSQAPPSPELREVLAQRAADTTEPRLLRGTAALALTAVEDPRGLPWLAGFLDPLGDDDNGRQVRILTLAAAAERAPAASRQAAVEALRAGIRQGDRASAAAAWLGDLRELEPDLAAAPAPEKTLTEPDGLSAARRILTAWHEPDPLTRAKLGLILSLEPARIFPTTRAQFAAVERRLDQLVHALPAEDRERLAEFVRQLVKRLREASDYADNEAVHDLARRDWRQAK